jgi:hypothetical protein
VNLFESIPPPPICHVSPGTPGRAVSQRAVSVLLRRGPRPEQPAQLSCHTFGGILLQHLGPTIEPLDLASPRWAGAIEAQFQISQQLSTSLT